MKHHRHPWEPQEEAYIIAAKASPKKVPHKVIARHLERSPRAVDQQVARMKEYGKLAMHRCEERELLERMEAEARMPERYPHQ
jgi:hypothetical protein